MRKVLSGLISAVMILNASGLNQKSIDLLNSIELERLSIKKELISSRQRIESLQLQLLEIENSFEKMQSELTFLRASLKAREKQLEKRLTQLEAQQKELDRLSDLSNDKDLSSASLESSWEDYKKEVRIQLRTHRVVIVGVSIIAAVTTFLAIRNSPLFQRQ